MNQIDWSQAAALNLDVEHPEQVAEVLYWTARAYRASAAELNERHEDDRAGRAWVLVAQVLERASANLDLLDLSL